jgi:hypothetical protein
MSLDFSTASLLGRRRVSANRLPTQTIKNMSDFASAAHVFLYRYLCMLNLSQRWLVTDKNHAAMVENFGVQESVSRDRKICLSSEL